MNHTDNLICMHTHTHTHTHLHYMYEHMYALVYVHVHVHTNGTHQSWVLEPTSVPSSATTSTIRNASATTCTVLQAPQHKHFIVTKMAENSCGGRLLKIGFLVILQLKNSATKHDTRKLKYIQNRLMMSLLYSATKHDTRKLKYIQNRLMMSLLYIVERLPKNMMKIQTCGFVEIVHICYVLKTLNNLYQ